MKDKIEKILDRIRPSIRMDGGDVEFMSYDESDGVVKVRLQGACRGCPMSEITLKAGIEATIIRELPEVRAVVAI